jgi:phage terminase small subunit
MPKGAKLTEKQRRFVEAFTGPAAGVATEAARMAGYSGGDTALGVTGHRLLKDPKIAALVEKASAEVRGAAIMDRQERQETLSRIARGDEPDARTSDQIKAIELLGKMQGDFIEKHHVTHEGTARVVFYPDNTRGPAPADG